MSRKNNKKIRKNYHNFTLEREKQNALKREKKASSKAQKIAAGGSVQKPKHKGVRLRKGLHVKGIKITDAESKRKARELLAAEQALEGMDVDEWEEVKDS